VEKSKKIFVAGHRGFVGSAIVRKLAADGFLNVIVRDRPDLDLRDTQVADRFLATEKPAFAVLAAKVGGTKANNDQAVEFLREGIGQT
jgi:GDP-L-fucose synthase